MKNVILVNGTMGVGKTATCRELQKLLPNNVFLDGDWCWDMHPFVVCDETKAMVMDNICHILNNFIRCSEFQNIIFCWVMHEQYIIDELLTKLDKDDCKVKIFSLIADKGALEHRLKKDIECGVRSYDVIKRSIARVEKYSALHTEKIDVSNISQVQAAKIIYSRL